MEDILTIFLLFKGTFLSALIMLDFLIQFNELKCQWKNKLIYFKTVPAGTLSWNGIVLTFSDVMTSHWRQSDVISTSCACRLCICFWFEEQGPVVQSIVSLTSSLRGQLVKHLMTLLLNTLNFFVEKLREAFALQKLLTLFRQKTLASSRY